MTAMTIAFAGSRRFAAGTPDETARAATAAREAGEVAPILIFDATSGEVIDPGSPSEIGPEASPAPAPARGRGRPRLGVMAREVTLLPRHWDWLGHQSGGASAALRRLVETARRGDVAAEARRRGRDSLYRFITAMAGDAPGYEEALRVLFADDRPAFEGRILDWPDDVRAHALTMADAAFALAANPIDAAPADRRDAVRRALGAAFPGAEPEALEPMAPGASGAKVFRLMVEGRAWVLRLDPPADIHRDPARQYSCMAIAAAVGLAPALAHVDVGEGLSITRLVAQRPADPPLSRPRRLAAIALSLKRLHAAPSFPGVVDYRAGMDGLVAGLGRPGLLAPDAQAKVLALWLELAAAYPWGDAPVSSHIDLNPSNVIFDGARPWIVDWEASGATDRFVDLAALANWFATDEAEVGQVLDAYFDGNADEAARTRLALMRRINQLFYGAMLLSAAAAERSGPPIASSDLETAPPVSAMHGEMPTIATWEGRRKFGLAFLANALRG